MTTIDGGFQLGDYQALTTANTGTNTARTVSGWWNGSEDERFRLLAVEDVVWLENVGSRIFGLCLVVLWTWS